MASPVLYYTVVEHNAILASNVWHHKAPPGREMSLKCHFI